MAAAAALPPERLFQIPPHGAARTRGPGAAGGGGGSGGSSASSGASPGPTVGAGPPALTEPRPVGRKKRAGWGPGEGRPRRVRWGRRRELCGARPAQGGPGSPQQRPQVGESAAEGLPEVGGKHLFSIHFFFKYYFFFFSPLGPGMLAMSLVTVPSPAASLGSRRTRVLSENPDLSQMFQLSLQLHTILRLSDSCKNPSVPGCELPRLSLLEVWPGLFILFIFLKFASK